MFYLYLPHIVNSDSTETGRLPASLRASNPDKILTAERTGARSYPPRPLTQRTGLGLIPAPRTSIPCRQDQTCRFFPMLPSFVSTGTPQAAISKRRVSSGRRTRPIASTRLPSTRKLSSYVLPALHTYILLIISLQVRWCGRLPPHYATIRRRPFFGSQSSWYRRRPRPSRSRPERPRPRRQRHKLGHDRSDHAHHRKLQLRLFQDRRMALLHLRRHRLRQSHHAHGRQHVHLDLNCPEWLHHLGRLHPLHGFDDPRRLQEHL